MTDITNLTVDDLLSLAAERAATEVVTWIPGEVGDNIRGQVVEVGTITTKFGDYFTTTLHRVPDYREGGKVVETSGDTKKLVRVAWMGAVLQSTYMRLLPEPDDVVALHYQSVVTPQSGANDYPLIVAAVFDHRTGKAKLPVDFTVRQVTAADIANADRKTRELPRSTVGADDMARAFGVEDVPTVPEKASEAEKKGNGKRPTPGTKPAAPAGEKPF